MQRTAEAWKAPNVASVPKFILKFNEVSPAIGSNLNYSQLVGRCAETKTFAAQLLPNGQINLPRHLLRFE